MNGVCAVDGQELSLPDVRHASEVFIGGAWEPGEGEEHEAVSPITEKGVLAVAVPSKRQAEAAVRQARAQGMSHWAQLPVADRVRHVRRMCDLIESRFDEIGRLWAVEAGMPVRYSRNLHRFGAMAAWGAAISAAEAVLADEWRNGVTGKVLVRREPAGVVVGVLAYNAPVVMFGTKIVPALLAGCPVVVKGAPESHLVLRVVAECAEEAGLPPGTLSILCGDATLGQWLTADRDVDLVSLTGGHRAAQDIIESTRGRFARTHLELGGKSAALILPDADIDQVVKSLVPGAAAGAGQVCALLTRILVPESRRADYLDALKQAWSRLTVGNPLDMETRVGPLANRAAFDRTETFLARALDDGGHVVVGGGRPADLPVGWYFEPTIVTDVDRETQLARTEVFGPITAVMTYADIEDGIELANDTEFGLAASVFTKDESLAMECAERIQAGSVALNTFGPDLAAPWGGRKSSGWGREGGPEGILEFTELKQVLVGPGLELGSTGDRE
jgi:acyl-CoA reductase-like NAD-dependent aldehyde dehydrogenase